MKTQQAHPSRVMEEPAVASAPEAAVAVQPRLGRSLFAGAGWLRLRIASDVVLLLMGVGAAVLGAPAEHESLKAKLQGLKGEDFDRAYVKAMANGHDKAVALFESASQQPQMPDDLKQFAASTLPTLEQHKEMAHSLHE